MGFCRPQFRPSGMSTMINYWQPHITFYKLYSLYKIYYIYTVVLRFNYVFYSRLVFVPTGLYQQLVSCFREFRLHLKSISSYFVNIMSSVTSQMPYLKSKARIENNFQFFWQSILYILLVKNDQAKPMFNVWLFSWFC